MGRVKSEVVNNNQLEEDIEKVKYMLFQDKKDRDFHIFEDRIESNQNLKEISQKDIIESILKRKDTFAVLPTGGGKSYCFQGPAFCFEGLTLVITPLVALIHDQVKKFNNDYKRLHNEYVKEEKEKNKYYHGEIYRAIYPGMNNLSLEEFFDEIINPQNTDESDKETKIQYKLIYVSPERLSNPKFIREFKKREEKGEIKIDFVVVDEAHCISQWGYGFRESYLTIGNFINKLKSRPVIAAFSATVTKRDIQQIWNLLKFNKKSNYFLCYKKRNNLNIKIIKCKNKKEKGSKENSELKDRFSELNRILKDENNKDKRCIIYCNSVKTVEYLYKVLNKFNPAKYHGKLPKSQQKRNLEMFTKENNKKVKGKILSTNIMIATKAFGMGIDYDDIEIVIHYDSPRSLEEYYQEIGRAGRSESISANCYLLFSESNMISTFRWSVKESISEKIKKQPISSNFTIDIEDNINICDTIRFYMYYRMARVWGYCNKVLEDRDNEDGKDCSQDYILEYFSESEIEKESIDLINKFYKYLCENILDDMKEDKKKKVEKYCLYYDKINDKDNQKKINKKINKIVGQINELHINNTRIANYLRWSADEYNIEVDENNVPKLINLTIEEWRRKEDNVSKARTGLMYTDIHEDCVFIRMISPKTAISDYIMPMWEKYSQDEYIKVMYVVNQKNNKVERILRKSHNEWNDIADNDVLVKLMDKEVTGLFPKDRYEDWYNGKDMFVKLYGKRQRKVAFAFKVDLDVAPTKYNNYKLDYFDLCVADAIYSIEINGRENIYLKTIWEVLSGDNKNVFSRKTSKIKVAIEESIEKMQKLRITILDEALKEPIENEVFLPIKKGEDGYSYEKIPPLYRYAELLNGEIVRVPVCLLNGRDILFLKNKKEEKLEENEEEKTEEDKEKKEAKVNQKVFSGTQGNMVLFHYLLHRIAISRRKNRGNYIKFDTIFNLLDPYISQKLKYDTEKLKGKVISIMCYYKKIGYIRSAGYIKDFEYVITPKNDSEKVESLNKIEMFINQGYIKSNFDEENNSKGELVYYKSTRMYNMKMFKKNGYVLTKECREKIRKKEESYIDYDGIIILRSTEAINQMKKKVDNWIQEIEG